MKFYQDLALHTDIMFVNDMLFLTSIGYYEHYSRTQATDNLAMIALERELRNIVTCYTVRVFKTILLKVDKQHKALKDRNLVGVLINLVSKGEHVKMIER